MPVELELRLKKQRLEIVDPVLRDRMRDPIKAVYTTDWPLTGEEAQVFLKKHTVEFGFHTITAVTNFYGQVIRKHILDRKDGRADNPLGVGAIPKLLAAEGAAAFAALGQVRRLSMERGEAGNLNLLLVDATKVALGLNHPWSKILNYPKEKTTGSYNHKENTENKIPTREFEEPILPAPLPTDRLGFSPAQTAYLGSVGRIRMRQIVSYLQLYQPEDVKREELIREEELQVLQDEGALRLARIRGQKPDLTLTVTRRTLINTGYDLLERITNGELTDLGVVHTTHLKSLDK